MKEIYNYLTNKYDLSRNDILWHRDSRILFIAMCRHFGVFYKELNYEFSFNNCTIAKSTKPEYQGPVLLKLIEQEIKEYGKLSRVSKV